MNSYSDRLSASKEATLARLHHWSAAAPDAAALLHKRRGRWRAFRWADVENEVARRAETLRAHGFDGGSRLAVSGAYEPDLIFIALAALTLGGAVLPMDRGLQGDDLTHGLAQLRPTHAFVQGRRVIGHWLTARIGENRIPLFSSQSVARDSPQWQILSLNELPEAVSEPRNLRRHLGHRPIVWVDEGTEWHDGLNAILESWLQNGVALAFPEAEGSVARDREEVRPTALLSSQTRRRMLNDEISQRLGGWSRRFAEARPRHPLSRLIIARRDAVLGLGRLRPAESQQP